MCPEYFSKRNDTGIKINKAIKRLDPKVKRAIDFSYNKISDFHRKQLDSLKNISNRNLPYYYFSDEIYYGKKF